MKNLKSFEEKPPAWFQQHIAALKAGENTRGRPTARSNSPKRGGASQSPSARVRSTSRDGFRPKNKFIWKGGCHHCNGDHKRSDCPEFLAIKAKNGGKVPDGYKGVREIAYEKWRSKQRSKVNKNDAKKNGVVKTLSEPLGKAIQQPIDDEHYDSDSDFSESELPMSTSVHSQRALTSHVWEPVSRGSTRIVTRDQKLRKFLF